MADLAAGTMLAGYRIESLVGRGASGSVYLAQELVLDRRVALKTLAPELAADARFRDRFLRESRIAAGLEHPGILPIYAAGEADGVVYLAMRFVEGSELGELIEQEGALPAERTLHLLGQVAEALDAAHRRGLIHRDVKPGNILVDETDRAYLTDFGLATHAASVDSLSRDTPFAGTIDYIAPEQARGEELDGRADLYSLGCVLYECLAGQPPYRRSSELAAVLAHLNDPAPQVAKVRPELAPLDPVIARALSKTPEKRQPTASALLADARAALGGAEEAPQAPRVAQLRTFLITDVRGYTRYTQEHGDEAAAELAAEFARIVQEVVSPRDGRLLELRGDEALVVFESARNALQAAVELQQRVAERLPRGIGVGLDAGEAVPVGRGYRGAALNTAARLCARARPGEILASEGVVHLAGSAKGVAYGIRRPERLKGFERPVVAVEIHPAGVTPGRRRARTLRARARATRRRTRAAVLVAVAAVAGAITAAVLLSGSEEPALAANSLGALDAKTGKPRTVIRSPGEIVGMINDGRDLWGIAAGGHVLQRIDGRSRELARQQIALPVSPYWFAPVVRDGVIWASDPQEPALLPIDIQYGRIGDAVELPRGREADGPQNAQGVAVTRDGVWTAYGYPKRIAHYTPSTKKTRSRPIDDGAIYDALVAAEGDVVWVVDRGGRRLLRIDADNLSVAATARLHSGSVADARVYRGVLWVAMQGDGGVWRIDREGNVLGKVETGATPYALATGADAVWVANANSGTVTRIVPETAETTSFATGHRPISVGVSGGDVWVFAGLGAEDVQARVSGKVVRQAAIGNPYWNLDPVTCCSAELFALHLGMGVQLMDYRTQKDGTAKIVPSAAAAQPVTADGGKTWELRVRPGFRFSPPSRQGVTAETFRYTLERALSPKLSNPYCRATLLSDVAGEEAFVAGKAEHVAGITAQGDRLTIELTEPSWTLPARLAMPCFTAVPIGTPVAPDGLDEPIPSAGPYYVDYNLGDFQLVVKKNPNWAGPEQPNDGLVVTENLGPEEAGRLVEQGKADWAVDDGNEPAPAFTPGGRYERLYGEKSPDQRYFREPSNGTRFLLFNTTAGPLADIRLRRAIALALDRTELAKLADGAPRALFLPPGIPGYGPDGADARRPSLARARALVDGRRVHLLLVASAGQELAEPLTREVQKELERVGIEVDVKIDADPWGLAKAGQPRVDILLDGWFGDYPDGDSFFTSVLDPERSGDFYPRFIADAHWLARIRAAARTPNPARAAAYRRLDVDLARDYVPVTGFSVGQGTAQLFSERVGCQAFVPLFGSIGDPTSFCLS